MALHFIRPLWLWLLPVAVLIPVMWRVMRKPSGDWSKVCDAHLLRWLSVGQGSTKPGWLGPWVAGLVWLIATLALAGPSWEQLPDSSFSSKDARVLVLDLSASMLAEDLKPNRLTQARFKLADILDAAQEGQTGLVAFAGDAFVVAPLTSDTNTISNMLPALRPDIMPVQGSRPDRGLEMAAQLLARAGLSRGEIWLIADGGNRAAADMAGKLAAKGIYTSVLGVGTAQGAPIPSGEGFVSDQSGNIVVARLQRDTLQAIATSGGGKYAELNAGSDSDALFTASDNSDFARRDDALSPRWKDMGPWLLLLLLPLLAYGFRRGVLFVLPLLALPGIMLPGMMLPGMLLPGSAQAGVWDDLWYSRDQQAQQALQQERATDAAALAKDPSLAGEALYRSGEFESASQAWAQSNTLDSHYNQGNALARAGQLDQALAAYDAALALDPENEDAAFNRDLVEQMKQQQEQQQEEQGEEGEEGDKSQDQQGDESQEGEKGDEESSEEQDQQQDEQSGEEEAEEEGEPSEQQMEQNWSEEDAQAMEQWLQRIPDDPGGLLRRKFYYQYQKRGTPAGETDSW